MPAVAAVIICFLLWNLIQAMWPIILTAAAFTAALYTIRGARNYLNHNNVVLRGKEAALAARADQQHNQIIAGKWVAGTYGNYLPPKGLRKVGYLRSLK